MISFNLSAIDIILAISIIALFILYLRKIQEIFPDQLSYRSLTKGIKKQNFVSDFPENYSENCDFSEEDK